MHADVVGKIAVHPVTKERRRHLESGDTILQIRKLQRLDPGGVVVLPQAVLKLLTNLTPRIIRHFSFNPSRAVFGLIGAIPARLHTTHMTHARTNPDTGEA
jgi:hypothetical protein